MSDVIGETYTNGHVPETRPVAASWAREMAGEHPGDDRLPFELPGVNVVINRPRLSGWLEAFRDDVDVADFVLLDVIATALSANISSTGMRESVPSLAMRPFRLWEYVWLYKTLNLANGGKRVLDLGGTGTHLTMLAALAGNDVESIDINPKFVSAGLDCARTLGIDTYAARVADMTDLSMYESESFDVVMSASVLEHLTGEGQALAMREVSRLLKPGGLAGITFDYGDAAPGANIYLPPPHCPPPNAQEALRRFVQGDLAVLGNVFDEDPVADSLFASRTVHYTIGSLFLGRPPATSIAVPGIRRGYSSVLKRLSAENVLYRVFRSALDADASSSVGRMIEAFDERLESAFQKYGGSAQAEAAYLNAKELEEFRASRTAYEREYARVANALEEHRSQIDIINGIAQAQVGEIADLRGRLADLARSAQEREDELLRVARERESEFAEVRDDLAYDLAVTTEALQASYTLQETERVHRVAAEDTRDALIAEIAALRDRLEQVTLELEAINRESPLGLFIRKALKKMPPPHALPLFNRRRINKTIGDIIFAVGRRAGHEYFRRSVPQVTLPRITIVTPVFNGAAFIDQAIRSVLTQYYPNLEYIVVDGGSTDDTVKIASAYSERVIVTSQPDNGMYDAVHRGFRMGTGEIFGYLNADDMLEPDALNRVGTFFATHPDVEAIYHEDIVQVNGWRFPNVAQPPGVDADRILRGHVLFQDGVFFRRDAYFRAGGANTALRYAGDSELWLKMARKTTFVRQPGHVSTFRVRHGQLSGRMDEYNEERGRSFAAIRKAIPPLERVSGRVSSLVRRAANKLSWRHELPRLFYPIDFTQMPPPDGVAPNPPPNAPIVCPITGAPADRLLFSSPDTRFGHELINYIYYVPESHSTVTYPPIDEPTLSWLYERYYSQGSPWVRLPSGTSPYRNFQPRGFLPRLALTRDVPGWLAGLGTIDWNDQTFAELSSVLRSAGVNMNDPLSFLDVGCFRGEFLDVVREKTRWQLSGLEPNPQACEDARERGHEVYNTGVEHIASVVPLGRTFDLIWMGQAIEHVNDPLAAMMALRTLLKPNGRIVLSTPNLDSAQIDMFGPTWAQWHPPYHRYIFSMKSLQLLAERTNLRLIKHRTFSHPYWSALNVWLNQHGLGAAIPHGVEVPAEVVNRAARLASWSKILFDWRGKGDYIVAIFGKNAS